MRVAGQVVTVLLLTAALGGGYLGYQHYVAAPQSRGPAQGQERAAPLKVEAVVASAVERFASRISRVQVHLGDENSASKGGAYDKRCMMEARLDGRPPIAVTQQAATLDAAMDGAAAKLERSIDSMLGRLRDR